MAVSLSMKQHLPGREKIKEKASEYSLEIPEKPC